MSHSVQYKCAYCGEVVYGEDVVKEGELAYHKRCIVSSQVNNKIQLTEGIYEEFTQNKGNICL